MSTTLSAIERFLGWSALPPIAMGLLLATPDTSLVHAVCVLVVFAHYSVKIDQIHAQVVRSPIGDESPVPPTAGCAQTSADNEGIKP